MRRRLLALSIAVVTAVATPAFAQADPPDPAPPAAAAAVSVPDATGVRQLTDSELAQLAQEELAPGSGTMGGGDTLIVTGDGATAAPDDSASAAAVRNTWSPPGVQGVDVSNWSGTVNWPAVFNQGGRFAYVKATKGTNEVSPLWGAQFSGAANAGLMRGSYHFALPPMSSATTQAQYFAAHGGIWKQDGKTLPPVLDMEWNPYPTLGNDCYNMTPAQLQAWISEFVRTMHGLTGRHPVIYTSRGWWNQCVQTTAFGSYPLWVARWAQETGPLPNGWSGYHFWQYSDSGPLLDDSNVWKSSYSDLVAFAWGEPSTGVNGPPGTALPASLTVNQPVTSPNGMYRLVLQADGNLVTYDELNRPIWASNTFLPGASALNQADGNLVLYSGGQPRWATMTAVGAHSTTLQDDGNLVIRNSGKTAVWDSFGFTRSSANRVHTRLTGLAPGQTVYSLNGSYRTVLEPDGNLVTYRRSDGVAVWASNTYSAGSRLVTQADGNAVLYSATNQPLWATGTAGRPNAGLFLQDDGNLVVADSAAQWDAFGFTRRAPQRFPTRVDGLAAGQTATSLNGWYRLVVQADGNLVLYRGAGALWASNTYAAGSRLVKQGDGNYVLIDRQNRPVWASGTSGHPGATMFVQDDGNVVVADSAALWWTGTAGR